MCGVLGLFKKKKVHFTVVLWERSHRWGQLKVWTWLQLWLTVLAFPFNYFATTSRHKYHRYGWRWWGSIRELKRMSSSLIFFLSCLPYKIVILPWPKTYLELIMAYLESVVLDYLWLNLRLRVKPWLGNWGSLTNSEKPWGANPRILETSQQWQYHWNSFRSTLGENGTSFGCKYIITAWEPTVC